MTVLENLTPLDMITYRAALALHFIDSVTGKAVTGGMRASAWAFDPAAPQLARRVDEAEKSQNSGIYGYRSLPGLNGYQIGEPVTTGSLAFILKIEDLLGRYLPQTRRYALPLALPAVQEVALFPAPNSPTPTGYAAMRGRLLRTTTPAGPPPDVSVIEPARWSRVAITIPTGSPGDLPVTFFGQADGRGSVLIMVPYPLIAEDVLLNEASWTISASFAHQPAAQETDYDLLGQVLSDLDQEQTPPFQATLDGQGVATIFSTAAVVDAQAQTYRIVGPTSATVLDLILSFGRPLILRTQVDGDPDHPLSELLMMSA